MAPAELIRKELMDSIIDVITAAIGVITAGATVVLAIITWRYVRLTNRLLKATTNTPKFAIYLVRDNGSRAILRVENIGTGPAYDVRFETDFSFWLYGSKNPEGKKLEDVGFLRNGINYLQPVGKRECIIVIGDTKVSTILA